MQLRLKTINAEEHVMTVEKSTLIMQFRQEVGRKLKVDSERIRLIFAGRVLNNIDTIDQYDIIEGSVIHAVVRPVGAVASTVPTPAPVSRSSPYSSGSNNSTYSSSSNSSTSVSGHHTININASNLPAMFGNMSMGQIFVQEREGEDNSMGSEQLNAMLSNIFSGNMEANAAAQGPFVRGINTPVPVVPLTNQVTVNPTPVTAPVTLSRSTILRAHEQFGAVVERGVSSIRCINENLYRTSRDSTTPPLLIPDDVDTRTEDPSLAMAQILSELNTSLTGLQVYNLICLYC
jgi:hypothetical protein